LPLPSDFTAYSKITIIRSVDVIATDEFVDWYADLEKAAKNGVDRVVDLLELSGVALGHPYSSAIHGSRFPLRELRVKSGNHTLRIIYAFDPQRDAVLIIGGDKTGDDRFYKKTVPWAERIWAQYLKELAAAKKEEEL
jgi:hypothetical protein